MIENADTKRIKELIARNRARNEERRNAKVAIIVHYPKNTPLSEVIFEMLKPRDLELLTVTPDEEDEDSEEADTPIFVEQDNTDK